MLFLLTSAAQGRELCLTEAEPNDQIFEAASLEAASCFEGFIGLAEQDRFVWTIPAGEDPHGWELAFEGGYAASAVTLQSVTLAADGTRSEGAEVLRLQTDNGAFTRRSEEMLLRPGEYLVTILSSGAALYRVRLAATLPQNRESEPNNAAEQALALSPGQVVTGDLQGNADFFRFTIPPAGARRQWSVEINGPYGEFIGVELLRGDGQSLLSTGETITQPLQIGDLGLDPGDYLVKLGPPADAAKPYTIKLVPGGPRVPSRESEPNDSLVVATPLTLGRAVVGRLSRGGDVDVHRLDIGSTGAGKVLNVVLQNRVSRSLCLQDAAGKELQCRSGTGLELANLALAEGRYAVAISGGSDRDQTYSLTARVSGPQRPDTELEPNDNPAIATPIEAERTIRARLSGPDTDIYRLHVEGKPQLWSMTATGTGIGKVTVANQSGAILGSGETSGTAETTARDVFLLPGDFTIGVTGLDGDYTLVAQPTGPPDLSSEREPNDADPQAERLAFGVPRKGRLSSSADRDVYRFSLFAPDHVRLEVAQPDGDEIGVELEWGYPSPKRPQGSTAAGPFVYDALLDPGDYIVRLQSQRPSSSPYSLLLTRADLFDLPGDLEPNDSPGQARPLPPSQAVNGKVDYRDVDWFALPVLERATSMRVEVTGDVTPSLVDGLELLPGAWQPEAHAFQAELPAERPLRLGVSGRGPYSLRVAFAGGPEPAQPAAALPMTLAVSLEQPVVAAFWIRGQRVAGVIDIANTGQDTLELELDLSSSHFAYRPQLAAPRVVLAAGARASVPIEIIVAPDAWANQAVEIVARARTAAGPQATAKTGLTADPVALPVAQDVAFPLPPALLGGFNVASRALGGVAVVADGDGSAGERAALHDGLVGDARIGGLSVAADQLPVTLTTEFGGDKPWNIAGIAIHPQLEGRLYPAEQLRDFELLLSQDGTSFEPVLSGSLTMLPVEQAFVLDRPMPARAAQLLLKSNHADNIGRLGLGEWKVIAAPGQPQGLSADIAEWARGGHVVRTNVLVGVTPADGRAMLGGATVSTADVPARIKPEWVIGFHENRAAQIRKLEWVDGEARPDQQQFSSVEVAVSTDGPLGPWTELGTWTLEKDAEGKAEWELAEPVWARFVRFTSAAASDKPIYWAYPKALRIFERTTGGDYLSILGEWGQYNRNAIFEHLRPAPPLAVAARQTVERGTRDKAQALPVGEPVAGEVRLNEIEDWFAVEVPQGVNTLTLTASGEPTVDVDMALEDGAGTAVPLKQQPGSADRLVFAAQVQPGRRYSVRIHEPLRSVAIAYDTSASLTQFAPMIQYAMMAFAAGVAPGREFVNLMNFESPFLLDEWTDQPWVLQSALLRIGLESMSSDLEGTLINQLKELELRRGVRAIIVVTDAESPGHTRQPELWAELSRLRPRIFAAHIGGGADPQREKQLMQDMAAANGGFYASARTQAEMDVVAERAAAWLRRPTRYQLVAEVHNAAPPAPGTLQVIAADITQAAPAAEPQAADAAAAAPAGAVELILDASGSMLQRLEGKRRIEIAREVLSELVTETLAPGQPLAFRVFGDDSPGSCETRLAAPLAPLEPGALARRIKAIKPKNLAKTPIGASLRAVAEDLAEAKGARTVVLVTDGEETCDGDPQKEIEALRAAGFDVRVNIVGFAVDDAALKQTFQAWAQAGGGRYFDAANSKELGEAVREAVTLPFRIIDAAGATAGSGTVGGPAVTLPAGTYKIEIGATDPSILDGILVEEGQLTSVSYAGD